MRRVARRVIIAAVVLAQLFAVAVAYDSDHRVYGFQMFGEADEWRAEIVRVDADGTRHALEDGWAYRWSDLVRGDGLTGPWTRQRAGRGQRSQLAYFEAALDWVAEHTPLDTETRYLEAQVWFYENGRGPMTRILRSVERPVDAS